MTNCIVHIHGIAILLWIVIIGTCNVIICLRAFIIQNRFSITTNIVRCSQFSIVPSGICTSIGVKSNSNTIWKPPMSGSGKPFHASVILQRFAQIITNPESLSLSGTTLHVNFLQNNTELKDEYFVKSMKWKKVMQLLSHQIKTFLLGLCLDDFRIPITIHGKSLWNNENGKPWWISRIVSSEEYSTTVRWTEKNWLMIKNLVRP